MCIRDRNNSSNAFLLVATPVDVVTIANSSFQNNRIRFISNKAMSDYGKTTLNLTGCTFAYPGKMELIKNGVPDKVIALKTSSSVALSEDFSATITPGRGKILVDSDLPGLKPQ